MYAEFLMDEVLRGDFETRQDALAKASHMTIAEKRKVENLPFIDGTDRIFLNAGILPMDAIDAQAPVVPTAGNVIPLPVARSVLGRLSWQGGLDEVDPAALTAEVDEKSSGHVLQALAIERANGGTVATLRDRLRDMAKE